MGVLHHRVTIMRTGEGFMQHLNPLPAAGECTGSELEGPQRSTRSLPTAKPAATGKAHTEH